MHGPGEISILLDLGGARWYGWEMAATREQIQETIDVFVRAAEANRATPARRGNVIVLGPDNADDCLVTGDLHGHRRNFDAIMTLADLDSHPRRHLVMQEVCHGGPTHPGGGCQSHLMLARVAELKVAYPERFHFMLSNHELSELTDYPIIKGKKMLNLAFRLGLQETYGDATDNVRTAYCEFLRSCPLAVRLPAGVFVSHSLPEHVDIRTFDATVFERAWEPKDLSEHGPVFDVVWGRDHRPDNARAFAEAVGAKVLIHGHEPCLHGYNVPNEVQLVLDCCTDRASCVLLPMEGDLSHAAVVDRVQSLGP